MAEKMRRKGAEVPVDSSVGKVDDESHFSNDLELEDGAFVVENDSDPGIPDMGTDLDNWLSSMSSESGDYRVEVYKRSIDSRKKSEICDTWHAEIPEISEIRDRWGGGQYRFLVKARNSRGAIQMRSYRVNIAEDRRALVQSQQTHVVSNQDPIERLSSLVVALRPILEMSRAPVNTPVPAASPDPFGMVNAMVDAMKTLQREQMNMIAENGRRLQELTLNGGSVADEEEETGKGFDLNSILQLAKPFIDQLSAKTPNTMVIKALKNSAEYKKIIRDARKTNQLVSAFEKEFGKERTEAVLRNIGVAVKAR